MILTPYLKYLKGAPWRYPETFGLQTPRAESLKLKKRFICAGVEAPATSLFVTTPTNGMVFQVN
jgi:hypothetical protein